MRRALVGLVFVVAFLGTTSVGYFYYQKCQKLVENSDTNDKAPGIKSGDLAYYTSDGKIAGLTIDAKQINISDGSGLDNSEDLSLIRTCSANQSLVWNGTSWVCDFAGNNLTLSSASSPLTYSPLTESFSISYDPGNLNVTGNQLTTIQGLSTSSTPVFAGITIGGINGILIATGGNVSSITNNSANWDTAFTHISNTSNPHDVTSTQILPAQVGQNGKVLSTNGTTVAWTTNSMGVAWGAVTGTLSDQSDLNNALAGKEPTLAAGTSAQYYRGDKSWQTLNSTAVGLGSVENTALSTWVGTANITTLGTIGTGSWNATAIADGKIASALTGKTYNGLTITTSTGALTIADLKTLTSSNTLTLTSTDGATLAIGGGGTLGTGAYATIGNYALVGQTMYIGTTQVAINRGTGALSLTGVSIDGSSGSTTGNAATVTTNANLTGAITSVGNATSIASQTGTGTKFVVDTSPVLVTPNIGVATATSVAIGANTLDTSEWAFLDGQDQGVKIASTPQFSRLGLGATADATAGLYAYATDLTAVSKLEHFRTGIANSIGTSLKILSSTDADMIDGFGTALSIYIKDSAGVENAVASIAGIRNGADNTGKIVFRTASAGTVANRVGITTSDMSPTTSNALSLGTTALQWSDLFLAEGGVINWDNGDATLTQAGDVITVAGADFKITTPGNVSTSVLTTDGTQEITGKTMGAFNYAADAGANDTYAITLSPAPAAYTTGMIVVFKANTINTGAATININALGAKTIVKRVSTALADGDILANMFCTVVYDGTNFVLMNPVVN